MRAPLLSFSFLMFCATPAFAISNDDVRAALEQRFKGDRTGACIAAGVIDDGTISTAYYCADPNSQRPYDEHTAFEIGSVTKTMTAALLAEFIARGEVALSDPFAKLLPAGTRVPSFNGRGITIGAIVTHTSGLPAVPPPSARGAARALGPAPPARAAGAGPRARRGEAGGAHGAPPPPAAPPPPPPQGKNQKPPPWPRQQVRTQTPTPPPPDRPPPL